MPSIGYSIHPTIKNKPSEWNGSYGSGWEKRTGSLNDLRKEVLAGSAFVAASMASSHRNSAAFENSSLAVVDIDNGLTLDEFKNHELAQHAAWVYTTSSHQPENNKHRFRVIFVLPQLIEDPELYKSIASVLINKLGGDKSCTDCCRLFYGNDQATEPLVALNKVLPSSLIDEARKALIQKLEQDSFKPNEIDSHSIDLAIHCLEHIIDPTEDGDRDRFIKITVSASSAGDCIFPYWSDWASRGHHGKGKNSSQSSERFFRAFRGSSLGTIFWEASNCDPDWRKKLPAELKDNGSDYLIGMHGKSFAGYAHSDFLGDPDDEDGEVDNDTQGLFSERTWTLPSSTTATELDDNDPYFDEPELDELFDQDDSEVNNEPDEPPAGRANRRGNNNNNNENTIGRIRDLLTNHFPGLRLNQMNQRLEYGPFGYPVEIHDPTSMYLDIGERENQVFQKTIVFDMANKIGYENRYHPVKSYLEYCAATAEPCDYFDRLASELLGVSNDPIQNPIMPCGNRLADVILKRFFIGAISRVLHPGSRFDWMPILIGNQNCGKTTFFQFMTPEKEKGVYPWVTTMPQSIEYLKDKPHALHSGFIVVMDEFERYTKRKYSEELKNLVSVGVDRSARKYENEKEYKRAFVLAGATNNADFLADPTGNRRFLPILVKGVVPSPQDPKIKIIDLDRLKRDRNSIWSAAYKCYERQSENVFNSYELSHISEFTNSFTRDNPIDAMVKDKITTRNSGYHKGMPYYTLADLFEWMDIPASQHRSMTLEITDCLKREKLKNKTIRENGKTKRVWMVQND